MSDLSNAATAFFDLLNQRPLDAQRYRALQRWTQQEISVFNLSAPVPSSPGSITKILRRQPRFPRFLLKWRPVFRPGSALDDRQCIQFFKQLFSLIEDFEGITINAVESGSVKAIRDTVSDSHTLRLKSNYGWQLILTTAGSGEINCVRQTIYTQPGDLMLFTPDSLLDYGRADQSDTWHYHWVYFQPQEQWHNLLHFPDVGPGIYRLQVAGTDYQTVLMLFEQVQAARYLDHPLHIRLAINLTEQLLIRCQMLIPDQETLKRDPRIEKALALINENYHQALAVNDLAKKINISDSHLAHLFKQHIGLSILDYRNEIRMSHACRLLSDSELPITRIAQHVGYGDSQYFSRCFKKQFNLSPREYRKRA